jgi:hypothetical protein
LSLDNVVINALTDRDDMLWFHVYRIRDYDVAIRYEDVGGQSRTTAMRFGKSGAPTDPGRWQRKGPVMIAAIHARKSIDQNVAGDRSAPNG